MTKLPTMRLSLFIVLICGIPLVFASDVTIQGKTFQVDKEILSNSQLLHSATKSKSKKTADRKPIQKSQTRLLPPCPPPPGTPSTITPTQNPLAPAVTFFPNNSVANALVPPPQTLGVNFQAGTQATNPSYLGSSIDPMGVVGPTQFVMTINPGLVTFDKLGNPDDILNIDPSGFLNLDGDFSLFLSTTDNRIRYDKFTDRFYYIILNFDQNGTGIGGGFCIAVSDSGRLSNATKWTVVNIFDQTILPDSIGCGGDQNSLIDFPTLGIDQNALYIGVTMFDNDSGLFSSNTLFVVQKASLLANGPAFITTFRDVVGFPGDTVPFRDASSTFQGVDNFDSNAQFGYFIGQDPTMWGRLILFRVINPGTTSPTLSPAIPIDVPTTGSGEYFPAKQIPFSGNLFGDLGKLDVLDDRPQMAHIRNGQLYTIHTILVFANGVGDPNGDRAAQRWYQIDVTGGGTEIATTVPTLVQAGTLWDPSPTNPLFYSYGAIMTNKRGDLTVCGTVSSNTLNASAFFTGRLTSDTLGTLRIGATVNDIIYAQGQGTFTQSLGRNEAGGQRWGDFSYTSVDPTDDMTMWTIQNIVFNGLYPAAIAQLLAP